MTRRGRKGGWGGGEGATGIKDWGSRKGEGKGDRQGKGKYLREMGGRGEGKGSEGKFACVKDYEGMGGGVLGRREREREKRKEKKRKRMIEGRV